MKKILIYNHKGKPIRADLILAFTCNETGKNYVAINNGDLVFSQDSSYNNLDILEIIKENNNRCYVTNIPDEDWEAVKNTLINEVFAKIKLEN